MNFQQFLNEQIQFSDVDTDQLHLIKQEINRTVITNEINKKYIEKHNGTLKIMDNDFYINGIGLGKNDSVVISCATIIEVSEEGGYVYYKPLEFTFNMDDNIIESFNENDRVRNENWKTVQFEVLKTFKKF